MYLDWPLIYLHIYWATEPPLSNVRCKRFDIEIPHCPWEVQWRDDEGGRDG